ncbi:hypothetical protein BH24ACT6_BH24ACT6_15170 [soil metagenome]
MTVLTDVLRGADAPAIYRVPGSVSVDDIAAEVTRAGWQLLQLDGSQAGDKAAVMAAMESTFGFPEWFGRNLDALADSLGDVRHEHGTVLLWQSARTFAAADPRQFNAVLIVLLSRARSSVGGPFVALLRDADGD